MASKNPHVAFQIDNSHIHGPFGWDSIFGEGLFEVVSDADAIQRAVPHLRAKFNDKPDWAIRELARRDEKRETIVFRIVPSTLTGVSDEPMD